MKTSQHSVLHPNRIFDIVEYLFCRTSRITYVPKLRSCSNRCTDRKRKCTFVVIRHGVHDVSQQYHHCFMEWSQMIRVLFTYLPCFSSTAFRKPPIRPLCVMDRSSWPLLLLPLVIFVSSLNTVWMGGGGLQPPVYRKGIVRSKYLFAEGTPRPKWIMWGPCKKPH